MFEKVVDVFLCAGRMRNIIETPYGYPSMRWNDAQYNRNTLRVSLYALE